MNIKVQVAEGGEEIIQQISEINKKDKFQKWLQNWFINTNKINGKGNEKKFQKSKIGKRSQRFKNQNINEIFREMKLLSTNIGNKY